MKSKLFFTIILLGMLSCGNDADTNKDDELNPQKPVNDSTVDGSKDGSTNLLKTKLVKKITTSDDSGLLSIVENTYNEKDLMIETRVLDKRNKVISFSKYEYNGDNLLLKLSNFKANSELQSYTEHKYDGKTLTERHTFDNGNRLTQKTVLEYNTEKKLYKEVTTSYANVVGMLSTKILEYSNGNVVKTTTYDNKNLVTSVSTHSFNDKNLKSKDETRLSNGSLASTIEYKYDGDLLVESILKTYFAGTKESKSIYEY